MTEHFLRILPYVTFFAVGFILSLVLTPLVRELNRRLGMVDKPSARRINRKPVPRGGGLAVLIASCGGFSLVCSLSKCVFPARLPALLVLGFALALVGYADDKFQLSARLKLLAQIIVAFLTWYWADVGFADLWPWLPVWADCVLTVFWIVGAVNAFNLIDGLDGLASGLALIATLAMAGSLFFIGRPSAANFHLVFAGALLGFLRYNYNPASVFLGDSGSLFIGYTIATLPLLTHTPNSFLVSVGVPLLAMGVPIFDTSLAILRRTIRRFLSRPEAEGESHVMAPDTDHLHHRILRSVGFSQRKAAWMLYSLALMAVLVGLVAMNVESHKAGLWLAAVTLGAVVIFKDMARVELYDAGLLLDTLAHDTRPDFRRRLARFAVPFYLVADILSALVAALVAGWLAHRSLARVNLMVVLPIRVFTAVAGIALFRAYQTVWPRAMLSNFVRLAMGGLAGGIAGTLLIYYAPSVSIYRLRTESVSFVLFFVAAVIGVRLVRSLIRDFFYALDSRRLVARRDVSRVLVYGAGLRYRTFRRELVRNASVNQRIVVGLLDDDVFLRNHYIGGLKVLGTLADATEAINALNVDTIVIAFPIDEQRLAQVMALREKTGVRVTKFNYQEVPL